MSVIVKLPEPNLWENICKEFENERSAFLPEDDNESVITDYNEFDPAIHNPVFYGQMFARVEIDTDVYADFDSAISHPSCVGYTFSKKPLKTSQTPSIMPPNRFICSSKDYLNHYIFPWLLPALEAMLKQAKIEHCFEKELPPQEHNGWVTGQTSSPSVLFVGIRTQKKRTKFNACDFITEYLYKNNPSAGQNERQNMGLWDIPFVKKWLKTHSRPPLPKSLIWSDVEAAVIIQSFWRGYLVRRQEDIQELRAWQREWREENRGIQNRVSEFWEEKMPDNEEAPADSANNLMDANCAESNLTHFLSSP